MRLFISVNFSHETRTRLIALQDRMRSRSLRGNFTSPDNLHLTLVFLGECDPGQTASAKEAVCAVRFEPFTITIAGGGYQDKGRRNLVFCELHNDGGRDKLRRLQSDLSEELAARGFALDQRKFWPHITLGREVLWKEKGDFNGAFDLPFPMIEEGVTRIELMKSERIRGKLTYTSVPNCEKGG